MVSCTKKSCKAYVKTDSRGIVIDDQHAGDHEHEPFNEEVLARHRVNIAVKRKLIRRELDSITLELFNSSGLV